MNSENVWRQGRSGSSKISSPSFLSSSTLMIRIDLITALRRSLSRSARSNFSNGIGLACSVESVSADGMDCIRDDRIGQPLRSLRRLPVGWAGEKELGLQQLETGLRSPIASFALSYGARLGLAAQ